jgi:predicted acyltransferase
MEAVTERTITTTYNEPAAAEQTAVKENVAALAGRLVSLDVFRGLTIAGMVLVNNAGDWRYVYPPLGHAAWHGWTPTDLIFPFFVFIVGVAIPLALERRKSAGGSQRDLYRKIARRSATIFALGLMMAAFPFTADRWANLRIPGVLQRLALCYAFASVIYLKAKLRTQLWITAALLLGYWALMKLVAAPGFARGDLTMEGSLASWVDRALLAGHIYRPQYDPEGILSTVPALATAMIGVFAGQWLQQRRETYEKIAGLFAVGAGCVITGYVWSAAFPINKALWTSSYVLFTGGMALSLLALCYWLIDAQQFAWARRGSYPFVVFGVNALALFIASGLLMRVFSLITMPKMDGTPGNFKTWMYEHWFASWLSPINASLGFALGYVALWWVLMWVLYQRRIFIKV